MVHRTRASAAVATRTIARQTLSLGLSPVPLMPRSKRPSGGERWNAYRATESSITEDFSPGENVGVLWGEPSRWAVDCDLDTAESIIAAERLLPPTLVYGRDRRPRSHYVYRAQGARGHKFTAPDGEVLCEVRSTGTQSVFVGSQHPEGDWYRFDEECTITELSGIRLDRLMSQVAAVVLLARSYPSRGVRHDFIHAVTGALLRDGYTPDETRALVLAVLACCDEDELDQRKRTIENTIEHRDDRTYGWKTLVEILDENVLKRVRTWLRRAALESVPVEVLGSEDEALSDLRTPFPAPPDGLLAEIAAWSETRAHVQRAEFDTAVALMCTALMTGNKFLVDAYRTPLQPYIMLVAPTGGGKESSLSAVGEFARRIDLQRVVFSGFQSYHALLDRLAEPPNMACWTWDESARKLKTASRSMGGQDYQVISWLLSLYGRAATATPGLPGRHNAIAQIERPFFLTFAAAQPTQLLEAITDADLATGVLNRFMLFDAGESMGTANYQLQDVFPSRLERAYQTLRDVAFGDPFHVLAFDSVATLNRFREFNEECRKRARDGREMWIRSNQNALIVAGLCAVARELGPTRITLADADYAIALSSWATEHWNERLRTAATGATPTERSSKTVERYIAEARKYARRAPRAKLQELAGRGLMPRSLLIRLARSLTRRELDDHLQLLIESHTIVEGEEEGVTVFWVPGTLKKP